MPATSSHVEAGQAKKKSKLASIAQLGLERRLALAFWVMSFIPILLLVAATIQGVDIHVAIYPAVGLVVIGYFFVARQIVRSVLNVVNKAKMLSTSQAPGMIDVNEENEIGELARSFNRINSELKQKVDELESSRQVVKSLLFRIGTAMNSYKGIDDLLSLIVENTAVAVRADMGNLMLVDGEKDELYVKTSWSNNGAGVDANLRIKLGSGIPGWVAKENRPMRSSGQAASFGFSHASNGESAILSVPLKLRDHPIGVLTVLRDGVSVAFAEDDALLLDSIGSQVSAASAGRGDRKSVV